MQQELLVAPEPDKISRKKCTPTVALLQFSRDIPYEFANGGTLIHNLVHLEPLGGPEPGGIWPKKFYHGWSLANVVQQFLRIRVFAQTKTIFRT